METIKERRQRKEEGKERKGKERKEKKRKSVRSAFGTMQPHHTTVRSRCSIQLQRPKEARVYEMSQALQTLIQFTEQDTKLFITNN
jgi:hypothetical protein